MILYIVIAWLFLCLVLVSYSAMDSTTKGKKSKKWHIISFISAWIIGIISPIIFSVDMIDKLLKKVGNSK